MINSPEDVISAELGPHEKLLWAGRPRQGIVFQRFDFFLVPFSLLWFGMAIVMTIEIVSAGEPIGLLIGGLFLLVGFYVAIGRLLIDARQRRNIFYGVTSDRIIIIAGLFSRTTKSLTLDTLADLSLTEKRNGSGFITFGTIPPWFMWFGYYGGGGWPGMEMVPCFDLDGNAREIFEIIRAAQRNAKLAVRAS